MERGPVSQIVTAGESEAKKKSLRQARLELTPELILQATAEYVRRDPLLDFSVQDIAAEAGMHVRSVYRHFPTRRALLEGYFEWVGNQHDAIGLFRSIHSLDDLPVVAREAYSRFIELPEYYRQALKIAAAMKIKPEHLKELERLRSIFDRELPNLDAMQVENAYTLIRHMIGGSMLATLTSVPNPDGGAEVSWAVSVLVAELKERNARAAGTRGS